MVAHVCKLRILEPKKNRSSRSVWITVSGQPELISKTKIKERGGTNF